MPLLLVYRCRRLGGVSTDCPRRYWGISYTKPGQNAVRYSGALPSLQHIIQC